MLYCTCCMSEVTVPYFHQGKPYGYTCIKKVTNSKVKKSKAQYIPCKVMHYIQDNGHFIVASVEGKKVKGAGLWMAGKLEGVYDFRRVNDELRSGNMSVLNVEYDGFLMVANDKGNKVWKNI